MAMQMDLSLYQKLEMRMRLAPQIIQSIEILQLPTLELQQRINQEMLENPVLEQLEPEEDADAEPRELEDSRTSDESEFEKMEEFEERLGEYSSQAPARAVHDDRDPKMDAMQNTAAKTLSLQEHLAQQLAMLGLDEPTHVIAENIVYNLDDNGYLQYALEEIVESMPPGTTVSQAERVLRVVQTLDPPGIGARDLRECLILQLNGDDPLHELGRIIVLDHLDDLRMNRMPKIAKDTGRTMEEVRDAADLVLSLNPKPGAVLTSEQPQYVVPDVRVYEDEDGKYEVEICDQYLPQLHVSKHYVGMLKSEQSTGEEKDYVRQKMQAARWIIDAIEQRRRTLKKIMVEVVKHQREFFDKGVRFLRPLRMSTIAATVKVHVSTVSRAISDKYVETPNGVFEIRFFFAGSATTQPNGAENGEDNSESRESVKSLIREFVDKENKQKPLSDLEIINMLKERGITVARRTITKYRQVMNIPPSRQRMQY